ncbi:MAG: competence/damage-inducible protein A [Thermotoga sp.]|nr:MAG: competence/damage-inducible protein A [Thermotogota bacterium]RKX55870.1 MAG: competence/damage-inducible protein A [Thermotoga sp.]
MKKAVIITIGSELLKGIILDRNSKYLCDQLKKLGYDVVKTVSVGDDIDSIVREVRRAIEEADLVVTSGGLGPTKDDKTREGIAVALNKKLIMDHDLKSRIEKRVREFYSGKIPGNISKQAEVIEGAEVLENTVGSAPGQLVNVENKAVLILPGPPRELIPMFEAVKEKLRTENAFYERTMSFYGIPEAKLEEELKDILYSQKDVEIATMVDHVHGVKLRLTTDFEKKEQLDGMMEKIMGRLGRYVYGFDDETMEESVFKLLKKENKKIAFAESCTGGLISSHLVNVPGSSEVFVGAVVAYSNDLKERILGVSRETLMKYGAVSEKCVREMSEGLHRLTKADLCLSVSGIAGPTGGTPEKPVGTVFLDLYDGKSHYTKREFFKGNRNVIRLKTSVNALNMVREYLIGFGE